jgi:uncharacterized protein (UPF0297 family)
VRKLSLNIQTFSELIENDRIYIDKTAIIHKLITDNKTCFFSRPRRFGKSLVLSTLDAIFSGKRELFEGLAISKTDYNWKKYPIISLSFGRIDHATPEELKEALLMKLHSIARVYDVPIASSKLMGVVLESLLQNLSKIGPVVLLVDEYDKPILDHISNLEVAYAMSEIMKNFYTIIKDLDQYVRFIFVTGVSKFSKTALFSGFNNLKDLSQDPVAAELVGYTKTEIEHYFKEYLDWASKSMKLSHDELMNEIARWYDGYQFTLESEFEISPDQKKAIPKIYSPVSVMKFLDRRSFSNYWFETGTPTYLVKTIRSRNLDTRWLQNLENYEVGEEVFGSFELDNLPLEALLYQAGYLTIDRFDPVRQTVFLRYPNNEIQVSLNSYLLADKVEISETRLRPLIADINEALHMVDMDLLSKVLRILFANIPYQLHMKDEGYYHSIFQAVFWILGKDVQSEVSTDTGRADLVVQTKERIFVFEFKFNKTAQEAMDQILEKRYYEKYRGEGKPIVLVGLSFNYKNKKLTVPYVTQQL